MNIKSLAHICIKTIDLEKTKAFYCAALGMEKLFSFTRKNEVIGFYLKAGNNTFVEVFLVDQAEPTTTNHTLSHFCLETDAIEELRQNILDNGYSPGAIKMGADHSLQFWIVDPNGINMEFHQYNENSSQLTGQDVEVDW